jgi:hypothetical protein
MRSHLTFANVVASIALFIAIGGTSYAAITLPRDSVGARQIRSGAVASPELRKGAVTSRAIRNDAVRLRDLSKSTRASLRGRRGPAGPAGPAGISAVALRASVDFNGRLLAGNPSAISSDGANKRFVRFSRSLAGCVPTATLLRTGLEGSVDPRAGHIVVAIEGSVVAVETYNTAGNPERLPFNLIVAC